MGNTFWALLWPSSVPEIYDGVNLFTSVHMKHRHIMDLSILCYILGGVATRSQPRLYGNSVQVQKNHTT